MATRADPTKQSIDYYIPKLPPVRPSLDTKTYDLPPQFQPWLKRTLTLLDKLDLNPSSLNYELEKKVGTLFHHLVWRGNYETIQALHWDLGDEKVSVLFATRDLHQRTPSDLALSLYIRDAAVRSDTEQAQSTILVPIQDRLETFKTFLPKKDISKIEELLKVTSGDHLPISPGGPAVTLTADSLYDLFSSLLSHYLEIVPETNKSLMADLLGHTSTNAHPNAFKIYSLLCKKGANPHDLHFLGLKAIHWAAKNQGPGLVPIINLLIDKGIDSFAKDQLGTTVFYYLADNPNPDSAKAAEILLINRLNIEELDDSLKTSLSLLLQKSLNF